MDADTSVCAAVGCDRTAKSSGVHCYNHTREFLPVYNKYKAKQQEIDKYIDDPSSLAKMPIERIMAVLNRLLNVIKMRKDYRSRAFRSEFHDKRHENFIRKLINLSNQFTGTLTAKFRADIEQKATNKSAEPGADKGCNPRNKDSATLDETQPTLTNVQDNQKNVSVILAPSLLTAMEQLAEHQRELEAELATAMLAKATLIAKIRQEFVEFLAAINQYAGSIIISIGDREARLAGSAYELVLSSIKSGDFDKRRIANGSWWTLVDWDITPTVDEIIERAYNGILPRFLFTHNAIIATEGVIRAAKAHGGKNFAIRLCAESDGLSTYFETLSLDQLNKLPKKHKNLRYNTSRS